MKRGHAGGTMTMFSAANGDGETAVRTVRLQGLSGTPSHL